MCSFGILTKLPHKEESVVEQDAETWKSCKMDCYRNSGDSWSCFNLRQ